MYAPVVQWQVPQFPKLKIWVRFLAGVLIFLSGCALPSYQPHGSVVAVRQPHSMGSGVVIGENLVITAGHVVDEDGYIKIKASKNPLKKYTSFYFVAMMAHERDNIVCLSGEFKFSPSAIFKIGCEEKDKPFMIQTRRGLFELTEFISQPGDSGSAVMCKHGRLVAIHWGHQKIKTKGLIKKKTSLFLMIEPLDAAVLLAVAEDAREDK